MAQFSGLRLSPLESGLQLGGLDNEPQGLQRQLQGQQGLRRVSAQEAGLPQRYLQGYQGQFFQYQGSPGQGPQQFRRVDGLGPQQVYQGQQGQAFQGPQQFRRVEGLGPQQLYQGQQGQAFQGLRRLESQYAFEAASPQGNYQGSEQELGQQQLRRVSAQEAGSPQLQGPSQGQQGPYQEQGPSQGQQGPLQPFSAPQGQSYQGQQFGGQGQQYQYQQDFNQALVRAIQSYYEAEELRSAAEDDIRNLAQQLQQANS